MENYHRKQLDVSILTERGNPNMRVMAGKALLDEDCQDLKFVENPPRGPRSVEVGRTAHSRYIRRPDGLYTITLRVDATHRYLRETLTSEIAEIAKNIELDYKLQSKAENVTKTEEDPLQSEEDNDSGKRKRGFKKSNRNDD